MSEDTAADDEITRVMELKEEQLPRLQSAKLRAAARLPEVDLLPRRSAAEELMPVAIGQADVKF